MEKTIEQSTTNRPPAEWRMPGDDDTVIRILETEIDQKRRKRGEIE